MNVFDIVNVVTTQLRRYCAIIPMNAFGYRNSLMVQRRIFYANVTMDVFAIVNVTTMQRRVCYVIIPMNAFGYRNALMVQRRRCCVNIPMNAFAIANVTTMQLGTSCPFDSPGLARNEPTPGKHPQGDSTP